MVRLHGFSSSNYYNIVKLTLLEKRLPFEEVLVYSGAGEKYRPDYLGMSPLGKVPCLETDEGFLSESRAICEYLEDAYPNPPLYPSTPFAHAKVSELVHAMDLYVDLPVRRVLRNFFGRTKPPSSVADDARQSLVRGAAAIGRLAHFSTFMVGDRFGAADISAVNHVPFARLIAKQVLDVDPFASVPGIDDYLARLSDRPTVKKVEADRNSDLPGFLRHLQKLHAA